MMKAAIGVFIIVALSKMLGFVREILIAYRFGAGIETDAFFISESISSVIFRLAGAGLGIAIIPIVSRIRAEKGLKEESNYIWNISVFFSLIAFILMGFTFVFTKPIVKLFAIGFEGERLRLAIEFTRISIPLILFNFLYSVFEAYNHSRNQFYIPASAGFLLNIPVIIYLLLFYKNFGMVGLIISLIIGYGLRIIYLYIPLRKMIIKTQKFNIRDKYLWSTFSIMLPIIITGLIKHINQIVDKTLASRLMYGSISALSYAAKTEGAINLLFVATLVTVLYPQFSAAVSVSDHNRLKKMFTYGFNSILLVVIPITFGIIILSYPIIKIVFMHGAFDEAASVMTASALLFYSLGIIGSGVNVIVDKIYFSFHDSKTTMKIGIITVVLNILLNIILVQHMQHNGLALATSIAITVSAIVKFYLLKYKDIEIEYKKMMIVLLKSIIASIIMGILIYFTVFYWVDIYKGAFLEKITRLILICLFGAGVYGVIIYVLKVEEIIEIVDKIKNKLLKKNEGN